MINVDDVEGIHDSL